MSLKCVALERIILLAWKTAYEKIMTLVHASGVKWP